MKILIIQTAFIGDVILATAVIEKLHRFYPDAEIDVLVRKGNETLFTGHPFIGHVLVWNKQQGKFRNLLSLASSVRKSKYTHVINLHRFASSGFITGFSGATEKIGFNKNPLSFLFTKKIKHEIANGKHEVNRNLELIEHLTDTSFVAPRIYPTSADWDSVKRFKTGTYICVAPASVWFTKQLPASKWAELMNGVNEKITVYLLGSMQDKALCGQIIGLAQRGQVINLSGELNLLASAALMKDAEINYVNDSAPMHLASAIDAPVAAVFCSTVPAFGFGPLSSRSFIIETKEKLDCRPCGLHGRRSCPLGHFECATTIQAEQLISVLSKKEPTGAAN